jgi:hypothetical protein
VQLFTISFKLCTIFLDAAGIADIPLLPFPLPPPPPPLPLILPLPLPLPLPLSLCRSGKADRVRHSLGFPFAKSNKKSKEMKISLQSSLSISPALVVLHRKPFLALKSLPVYLSCFSLSLSLSVRNFFFYSFGCFGKKLFLFSFFFLGLLPCYPLPFFLLRNFFLFIFKG